MKLKYILNEMKQVGILYHYTNIINLLSILTTNKLISKNVPYISFTRDKLFHKNTRYNIGGMECRLVIDGNKLSNNYKIKPYSYHFYDLPDVKNDESEEKIDTNVIKNIDKYIIDIELFFNENEYQNQINHKRGFESLILRYLPDTNFETLINFINK